MSLNTRRRGAELEDAIIDAAWEVLIEHGYQGFTYEAVAARAGTSRPVLYRRWPQRDDLLLATLRKFWGGNPVTLPDTGDLREDTIGFLRNADAGRNRLMTMISVQLMEYFRATGTSFRELRDSLLPADRPNAIETILRRAVARGDLPGLPASPRVVSLPFDLLRNEMMMTMRPVPESVIVEIVDDVWLPLLSVNRQPIS